MLHMPVRLLRFVGTGGDTVPDDLGPVLARGREAETARVLADALLAIRGWDVLLLTDMNPDCAFTAALAGATRAAGLKTMSGPSERIVYVDLPPTWEAWLETQSSHRRKRIRYIRKKFANAHQARFFVWEDPATLDEAFERLAYLHRKRWATTGQSHAFSTPEYSGFHRVLMKACMARGRLRLYCLELAGQVAAMQYCYKFRDGIYVMQTGYDPEFSDAGQALLWHITEHAIGEGNKVLDFLRGDHSYKDQASTGERHTESVTAFRNTPGAWAYRTRRLYLPAAKAQFVKLKHRLRPDAAQAT
jgi:CelD/BcsL family acetyltransferase involved in cellulose biosynthesis